jgi:hypothetical protein
MNNVEKAFTHRLYCPRKQLVKQAIGAAFPAVIVALQFAKNYATASAPPPRRALARLE